MRIYEPAQKYVDGKPIGWHFIVRSDEEGWAHAVGYCAEHSPHATAGEAEACYNQYRLDNAEFNIKSQDTMKKCSICGEWTDLLARYDRYFGEAPLCGQHQNKESLKSAIGQA